MGGNLSFPPSRIVATKYGEVLGRRLIFVGERQVDAFQGIPFAKPPVGELRFKKPEPPERWEGVRETKKWAPRAMQRDVFTFEKYKRGIPSEDCLYLNVFTPCWEPPPEGFAVLVYVHGGAFVMDGAMTYGDMGICENIVPRDIVVVTIQYRLGYLGFWANDDESECPHNLALWDQRQALLWVRENIGAFGGNPNNVTLVGQSAGGAGVHFLHLSPLATDLFHKLIPMAGNAEADWAFSQSMPAQCRKKARRWGVTGKDDKELMDNLRKLPAERFGSTFMTLERNPDGHLECTPILGGEFLPGTLEELRRSATPKPIMTGVCTNEALLFTIGRKVNAGRLKGFVQKRIVLSDEGKIKDETDFYISELVRLHEHPSNAQLFKAYNEAFSDYFMNTPTYKLVLNAVRVNGQQPVYHYVFEHLNPKSWGAVRFIMPHIDASHCTELAYLFSRGIIWGFHFTEDDDKVKNTFTTAITNFCKHSDPNGVSGSDLPTRWLPCTLENVESHYVVGTRPRMRDEYFGGRPAKIAQLWRDKDSKRFGHL